MMPDVSHNIPTSSCVELEVLLERAVKANPNCPEDRFLRRRAIVHEQADSGVLEAMTFLRASTWPIEPYGTALVYGRVTQSQGQSECLQAIKPSKYARSRASAAQQ